MPSAPAPHDPAPCPPPSWPRPLLHRQPVFPHCLIPVPDAPPTAGGTSPLARWRGSSIAARLLLGWPILGFSLNSGNPVHPLNVSQFGRVDKVIYILVWAKEKDAMRRQSVYFIILFRFMAAADKRQWSSAASIPRRKTRVKLCSRFCAANVPSHQICRSFSASRYSGLQRRSRLRRLSAVK